MVNNTAYHIPVLLSSSVDALVTSAQGVYVDVTFGGGGHSAEILSRLTEQGHLYAFDQDVEAHKNALQDGRFTLIGENFRYVQNFLRLHGVKQVQGILADLGVSSRQFDTPEKGFTYRADAPLDMRMNTSSHQTAASVLNEYSEAELARVFKLYGELPNARKLAYHIVHHRKEQPIQRSLQLLDLIKSLLDQRHYYKQLSMLFQALRIEVNQELEALEALLMQSAELIAPGGRLVVISYHSLEDRLVKNFIRYGQVKADDFDKDMYGNILRPFDPMQSKAMEADEAEVEQNVRARSAKMRVGIKR